MNTRFVILVAALFALLLAGCGAAGTPEPVSYDIDMTDFAFNPDNLEFKVDQQVTLNLTNSGALVHEIMFGRNVMMMDNRPSGYQEDMFAVGGVTPEVLQVDEPEEEEEMHEHEGFMVGVAESGTARIRFTVTQEMIGEWEMGCFEQDGVHYDAGMKGTVTVTP
jgi:uncharacterized cupredoxin-like copper-binding protein